MLDKDKIELPVTGSSVCPKCGEAGLLAQYFHQLRDEGKLPPKPIQEFMLQIPLLSALTWGLSIKQEVPTVNISLDLCPKCKVVYFTKVEAGGLPIQIQQQGPGLPGRGG